ncbi:cytochrome P450 [Ilyonectria sp. MPI-CAGE-AT-0026]|nr:cytochrome P450 [Ilyonectria sp. MPI-CAGE-AT-0026]
MSSFESKLELQLPGQNIVVLIVAALCLPLIYNVFFHPVARIPGPFFAKLSDIWHAYHLSTGTRHILLHDLHKKYGPLVRIGPNTISVDTNEGLQKIFSATSPIDKSPFYQSFAPGFDSSFAAVGDAFREKKSILSHAFAQKKLDAMEVTFMEHIKKLCEVMTAQKEVELDESLSALTIDILSDVCFGETFDLLHNPAEKKKEGTLWRWPLMQKMIRVLSNKFTTRAYPAERAIGAMINQRRIASGREDIFNYLLTAIKPGSGELFLDQDLFGEAIILFVAGSDTTSTALLTTLWHLLSHKNAYDNLAKEVRSKFRSIEEIKYQEAQHLPYLRAVIEESLRIFPPNSGFIPRQVVRSQKPFTLHNIVLPVGTEIGIANMALHRNLLYFEKPDQFIPERWIDGSKRDRPGFSPFSKGPRSCLGRNMAYMEMTVVLAALFVELDMEFQDPETEARQGYMPTDSFVLIKNLRLKVGLTNCCGLF